MGFIFLGGVLGLGFGMFSVFVVVFWMEFYMQDVFAAQPWASQNERGGLRLTKFCRLR